MSVEAVPTTVRFDLPKQEIYTLSVVGDAKGFTTRRNHVQGELLVMPKDYDSLRKFYSQFESKDQESVVLKAAPCGRCVGRKLSEAAVSGARGCEAADLDDAVVVRAWVRGWSCGVKDHPGDAEGE